MKEILHQRFNSRDEQIPPVRIKGFKRQHMAQLFSELGFTRGVEVGVAEGKFSIVLCETIPDLQLTAVDLWDKYYRGDHPSVAIKDRAMQDWALEEAHKRLDPYEVEFIRAPSIKAIEQIPDASLDFVYIDADHRFDYVMLDLILWSDKVKPSGIVSGHDYYRFRGAGVVDAVNAFTFAHRIDEWFVCDERETSFFWANERKF